MTLRSLNLLVLLCYICLQDISVNMAENIMQAKPSKWSEMSDDNMEGQQANDGYINHLTAEIFSDKNPYWQGDLQGFYTVHNISVTSDLSNNFGQYLGSAYVGVSTDDSIDCPNVDIFICGQCPEVVGQGETFTFTCSHPRPVRFVKVWRNIIGDYMDISEVEVEGTPIKQNGAKYQKLHNYKVASPMTSLTTASASDCGLRCHLSQPCLSFSYHPTAAPNCLLTTDPEDAGTAVGWTKYTVEKCSSSITCQI